MFCMRVPLGKTELHDFFLQIYRLCLFNILPKTPAVVLDMTPNLKTLLRIIQREKLNTTASQVRVSYNHESQ